MSDRAYTEADLRAAFRAGWQERNRNPGLKRQRKQNLNNVILGAIGGGRYAENEYIPDRQTYHPGIWTRSAFRKALSDSGSDRNGGDALAAPGEASQSGGAAASPTPSSRNPETPNDR